MMVTTWDIIIRIIFAIIVGGFVGYEREMRNRPAGFITHTLVCVGACVVSLMQLHMVEDTLGLIAANPELTASLKADVGRVVAQVITGVGFLGAGTIIFDKGSVKGLTTATTIWVVACVGLAIGMGYYEMAFIASLGIVFIMVVLKRWESKALDRKYSVTLDLTFDGETDPFITNMTEFFKSNKIQVRDIDLRSKGSDHKDSICRFKLYTAFGKKPERLIQKLVELDCINRVDKR